ncbi:MAG TPA: hypothetical protein VK861_06660 [Bacteroidales bacterium]|nr:hypothetical protein [Bacteroidales bacterium]
MCACIDAASFVNKSVEYTAPELRNEEGQDVILIDEQVSENELPIVARKPVLHVSAYDDTEVLNAFEHLANWEETNENESDSEDESTADAKENKKPKQEMKVKKKKKRQARTTIPGVGKQIRVKQKVQAFLEPKESKVPEVSNSSGYDLSSDVSSESTITNERQRKRQGFAMIAMNNAIVRAVMNKEEKKAPSVGITSGELKERLTAMEILPKDDEVEEIELSQLNLGSDAEEKAEKEILTVNMVMSARRSRRQRSVPLYRTTRTVHTYHREGRKKRKLPRLVLWPRL